MLNGFWSLPNGFIKVMEKEKSSKKTYQLNISDGMHFKLLTEDPSASLHQFDDTSLKKISFNGIRLLYGKLRFKKPVPVKIETTNPYIEMYYSLAGSRQILFPNSNLRSHIQQGHHNIFYIPDPEFYIEPTEEEVENITLQIQFTEEYFKRFMLGDSPLFKPFMEKMYTGVLSILSPTDLYITPEMYILLNDIVHCEKEGIIRQLYIETCVLKLLQLQFEQYQNTFAQKDISVKEYDIEKLYRIKEYLEENISANHTLNELAREAGLNDFKLKKGFKELFNTTVFGYLHELRMKTAKELLLNTSKPIADISEYCGYVYVQSFTTAFRKKFGITPEKLRR